MKKFIFLLLTILLFNIPIITYAAQSRTLNQGFYSTKDLNLSPDVVHTIQNNSPTEHVSVILFDSNEIVQEFIKLSPQSEKYILPAIQNGYEIVIIGNGEVTLS